MRTTSVRRAPQRFKRYVPKGDAPKVYEQLLDPADPANGTCSACGAVVRRRVDGSLWAHPPGRLHRRPGDPTCIGCTPTDGS